MSPELRPLIRPMRCVGIEGSEGHWEGFLEEGVLTWVSKG